MSLSFNIVDSKIKIILLPETPKINSITYTTTTTNTIIISWNKLSNLLTYNLICSVSRLNMSGITSTFVGTGANSVNTSVYTDGGGNIIYTINNETLGSSYIFNIVSVASDGIQSLYSSSYYITPLSTPSTPVATLSGSNINLSWDTVTNASSYNLICSDSTLNVNGILSSYTSLSPYIFSSGKLGTSYIFNIVAVASDGTQSSPSNNSNSSGIITSINLTPIAILSGSSIIISWPIVNGASSYNLNPYNSSTSLTALTSIIGIGLGSNGSSPTVGTSSNDGKNIYYNYNNLTIGYKYTFTINVVSNGTTSSASNFSTPSITYLYQPNNVSASVSNTSIIVSWNKDNNANTYNLNPYIGSTALTSITGIGLGISGSSPSSGTSSNDGTKVYYNYTGTLGNSYTFTIISVATDTTNSIPSSSSTSVIVLPPASNILVYQSGTSGSPSITIIWYKILGATSYNLNYNSNLIINGYTSANNKISYVYSPVSFGSSYIINVVGIANSITLSTITSNSITPLYIPSTPSPSLSNSFIIITWNKKTGENTYNLNYNGLSITGINPNTSNAGTPTQSPVNIVSINSNVISYTFKNGIAGTSYIFNIVAIANDNTTSSFSSNSTSVTVFSTISTPISVIPQNPPIITVSWTAVTGAIKYNLNCTTVSGINVLNLTSTSYTFNTITLNQAYIFYITAIASDGTLSSPSNNSVSITPLPRPNTPTVSLSADSANIVVTWTYNTDVNYLVKSFNLNYYSSIVTIVVPTTNISVAKVYNNATLTITDVQKNYSYIFTVYAITSGGNVVITSSQSLSGTTYTISWSTYSGSYTGYNVVYYATAITTTLIGVINNVSSPYTFTNGSSGISYTFTISAVANDNTTSVKSFYSNSFSVVAKPSIPSIIASGTSIILSWSIVSLVTSYSLYYYTTTAPTELSILNITSGTTLTSGSVTLPSINNSGTNIPNANTSNNDGTTIYYNFNASAIDTYNFKILQNLNDGTSSPKSLVNSVTLLNTPTNLLVSAIATVITISWVGDSNASSFTLNYTITTTSSSSGSISSITSSSNGTAVSPGTLIGTIIFYNSANKTYTYNITGIVNSFYTFNVIATSGDGTTTPISISGTTANSTSIAVLSQPTIQTATVSGTAITLSWGAVTNATGYTLTPYISGSAQTSIPITVASVTTTSSPASKSSDSLTFYYNFTGRAGTTYTFTVTANAGLSTSAASASSANVVVTAGNLNTIGDGLILWLDATDVNGNNTNPTSTTSIDSFTNGWVNKVTDSSYNNIVKAPENTGFVQNAAVFYPNVNSTNLPGFLFTASTTLTSTGCQMFATLKSGSLTSSYFIFFVVFYTTANQPATNNFAQIFGFSSSSTYGNTSNTSYNLVQGMVSVFNNFTKFSLCRNNAGISGASTNSNVFNLIIGWNNNGTFYQKVNGSGTVNTSTAMGTSSTNFQSFSLGGDVCYDRANTMFTGYVCEIAVYNTNTNMYGSGNFTTLENYFINKWNISRIA